MKIQKLLLTIFAFLIIAWPSYSLAQSGCCSWHGGVCGCNTSTGSRSCCDGTDSPSCGCSYSPPKKIITPKPIKDTTDYKALSSSLQSQLDSTKIDIGKLQTELETAKSNGLSAYEYSKGLQKSIVIWLTAIIILAISGFYAGSKTDETIGKISSVIFILFGVLLVIYAMASDYETLNYIFYSYSDVLFH